SDVALDHLSADDVFALDPPAAVSRPPAHRPADYQVPELAARPDSPGEQAGPPAEVAGDPHSADVPIKPGNDRPAGIIRAAHDRAADGDAGELPAAVDLTGIGARTAANIAANTYWPNVTHTDDRATLLATPPTSERPIHTPTLTKLTWPKILPPLLISPESAPAPPPMPPPLSTPPLPLPLCMQP